LPLVLDRYPAEGGDYLSIFISEFLRKVFGRDRRQVPQISLSQSLADAASPYQSAYGEVQLFNSVALSVSLLVPVHTNMIGIRGTAAPVVESSSAIKRVTC
jgi:hypothetical protein